MDQAQARALLADERARLQRCCRLRLANPRQPLLGRPGRSLAAGCSRWPATSALRPALAHRARPAGLDRRAGHTVGSGLREVYLSGAVAFRQLAAC
jgi:hypothetical protein